jgi:hypothetical protein
LPQPPTRSRCFDGWHRPGVTYREHPQTFEAGSQDQPVTTVVAQVSAGVHGGIHHHQAGALGAVDLVRAGNLVALLQIPSHRRAVQAVGQRRVDEYIEHPVPQSG